MPTRHPGIQALDTIGRTLFALVVLAVLSVAAMAVALTIGQGTHTVESGPTTTYTIEHRHP